MRLSIIVSDGIVVIDDEWFDGIDMSQAPSGVSAVQWYDTYGEVEYYDVTTDGETTKPANTSITSISDYQFAIDAHAAAKAALTTETVASGDK